MILFGLTCLMRSGLPFFVDPIFPLIVVIQFFLNRVLDAALRWLNFSVFWNVTADVPAQTLARSIKTRVKEGESEEYALKYRQFFFKRHKPWLLGNVDKVFTPRGLEKYRGQLSQLYQKMLGRDVNLDKYAIPSDMQLSKVDFAAVDEDGEESSDSGEEDEFKKDAWLSRDVQISAKPKTQKTQLKLPIGVSRFSWASTKAWLSIARRRLQQSKASLALTERTIPAGVLAVRKEAYDDTDAESEDGPAFQKFEISNLTSTSRLIFSEWVKRARKAINS